MKDKLRELAERWKRHSQNGGAVEYVQCSNELKSILDAEGDGGAVAWQEKVNEIANNIGESLNAGCDQDAVDRINMYVDELFALATRPHSPDAADSGRIRDALIAAQKLLRQNHDAIRGALDNHERKEATLVMNQIRDALAAQGQGADERKGSPEHQTEMLMARMVLNQVVVPPASPAGVPDARTEMDYEYDAEGLLDPYDSGHMAGWNDCRKVMLAAPSATPEGGEADHEG